MNSISYKIFLNKLAFPTLIAGFIFQLNFLNTKFVKYGLLQVLSNNTPRIVVGTLGFSLLCTLIFFSLKHILINKFRYNPENTNNQLFSFFSNFYLFSLYLILQPSKYNILIISICIPICFLINHYYINLYSIFRTSINWSIILKGILYISIFNLAPVFVLYFFDITPSFIEVRNIIIGSLIIIFPLIFIPKWNKIYLFSLLLIFYIPSIISVIHNITYGNKITESTYHVLWETNIVETSEYLKLYFGYNSFFALIALFIIPITIIYRGGNKELTPTKNYIQKSIIASAFILLSISNSNYKQNLPLVYANNYINFKNELQSLKSNFATRKIEKSEIPQNTNPYQGNETYVVVIGESLNKHHMSLYGYGRETNPLLSQLKDSIYCFSNVISPHSHTNPTLTKVLTFANNEDMSAFTSKRTIVEYAKDAGFKTYWISNQQLFNQYTTVASSIGTQADWYYFINDTIKSPINYYDENIFKPLSIALKNSDSKKLIFIHLLGNHGNYEDRYPSNYSKFKDWKDINKLSFMTDWHKTMINSYDNSVLYNDYIIYSIIHTIKNLDQNSFVLYFPDHGEEVYDYRAFVGHAEANASIYMFDIPFIIWISDKYKTHNHEKILEWPKFQDRKYQTDVVIHSIIDLMNLTSSEYNPKHSIISKTYEFKKRIIGELDYDEMIKIKKSITDN